MKSNRTTLYLPLKKEWFEMIESGDKREEYREIKPYWMRRLCPRWQSCYACFNQDVTTCHKNDLGRSYERVVFSYGYTRRKMTFNLLSVSVGVGNPNWGAPPTPVFILKLGAQIF